MILSMASSSEVLSPANSGESDAVFAALGEKACVFTGPAGDAEVIASALSMKCPFLPLHVAAEKLIEKNIEVYRCR